MRPLQNCDVRWGKMPSGASFGGQIRQGDEFLTFFESGAIWEWFWAGDSRCQRIRNYLFFLTTALFRCGLSSTAEETLVFGIVGDRSW